MAPPTIATPSSATTTPSVFGGCYDPVDVDTLFNYDHLRCGSPPLSPIARRSQAARQSTSAMANSNNTLIPTPTVDSITSQSFSGPSHQYDMHKQQTGIVLGALANTLAVNQPSNINLVRSQAGFGMSTDDSFFGTSPSMDEFIDFNAHHDQHVSGGSTSEMDMEFDDPANEGLPAFFFADKVASPAGQYVDPSTIEDRDQRTLPARAIGTKSGQGHISGRLYPGVHTQQAAKAKLQQQRQRQDQPHYLPPQSKPTQANRVVAHSADDRIVEERISRLLESMRQSSVAGSTDEEGSPSGQNGVPGHIARMRKEEEDMDEDERLLASEQGKKLTSKERRQLRNKVSARAFRSRRKEYIGQLEGEVAMKSNETNDLRSENRALREENTRLSDLTRMLLSSSAFSTFLDDLSLSSLPADPTSSEQARQKSTSTPRQTDSVLPSVQKDASPAVIAQHRRQAQHENVTQIGMTLLPESNMDFSALDLEQNDSWALGSMTSGPWDSHTSQVFSVMDIPQGPAVDQVDFSSLSGKTSHFVGGDLPSVDNKVELPEVDTMPILQKFPTAGLSECIDNSNVHINGSDPIYALYDDTPTLHSSSSSDAADETFHEMSPEKLFARYQMVLKSEASAEEGEISNASMDRFTSTCQSADAALQRISRMTSHF